MVVHTQTSSSSCWALLWCCYQTRTGMIGKDEVTEADLNISWYTRCAYFLLLSKFWKKSHTGTVMHGLQLLLEGEGESKNRNLLTNQNEQLNIKNFSMCCFFHLSIKVIITLLKYFYLLLLLLKFCLVFILLLDSYSHFSPWDITGLNTFIVPSKQLLQMYQNSFSRIFQLNTDPNQFA